MLLRETEPHLILNVGPYATARDIKKVAGRLHSIALDSWMYGDAIIAIENAKRRMLARAL